jgi:hypothetical protein
MFRQIRLWCLFALAATVFLAAWSVVPRPTRRGHDILDAVAAVQRRCPLNFIAERGPTCNWVTDGGVYLSRVGKTPEELDRLLKDWRGYDDRWDGVIYFKARGAHRERVLPFQYAPTGRALDYGDFGVYGDPELLKATRTILADEGFESVPS